MSDQQAPPAEQRPISNVSNETLSEAMREYGDAKDKTKAARLYEGMVLKKWEELGVIATAVKNAFKFRKKSEQEFQSEIGQFLRMMQLDGFPAGQVLFEGLDLSPLGPKALEEHIRWQCHDLGYQMGLAGRARDENMCDPGTFKFDAFDRGWLAGNETLKHVAAPKTEMASQRKERTPAPPVQPVRKDGPEPMWDDKAQAEANAAAARMDRLNAADVVDGEIVDDDPLGLGLPDVPPNDNGGAVAPKRPGRPAAPKAPAPVQMGGKRRGRPPRAATH